MYISIRTHSHLFLCLCKFFYAFFVLFFACMGIYDRCVRARIRVYSYVYGFARMRVSVNIFVHIRVYLFVYKDV